MEYCVCGHSKEDHVGWEHQPTGCNEWIGTINTCDCDEFKLDNLRLIEQLAKQKGLV